MRAFACLFLVVAACNARNILPPGIDELIAEASGSHEFETVYEDGSIQVDLDVLYTPEQWAALNSNDPEVQKGARDERYRWKNNIVPFEVESAFTETEVKRIEAAMDDWEKFTCIRFVRRTSETDYIKVVKGSGCSSYIGRIGRSQRVTLGPGCVYHRIIVHELGHAIGFQHEQKRPDRDDYVTILLENVQSGKTHNFNKMSTSYINDYGIEYDYKSVMHYSQKAFSKNGQPTIITKDTSMQTRIGRTPTLSFKDIQLANLMYKCADWCGSRSCPPGSMVNQYCTCWCEDTRNELNPVSQCGLGGPNVSTTALPTRGTAPTTQAPSTTTSDGTTGPRCIKSCTGRPTGYYQSCTRCDAYHACVAGQMIPHMRCATHTFWDDKLKMCVYNSTTCKIP